MYPHEVQAVMAKIVFFIFATLVLCFGRANAMTSVAFVETSAQVVSSK